MSYIRDEAQVLNRNLFVLVYILYTHPEDALIFFHEMKFHVVMFSHCDDVCAYWKFFRFWAFQI